MHLQLSTTIQDGGQRSIANQNMSGNKVDVKIW